MAASPQDYDEAIGATAVVPDPVPLDEVPLERLESEITELAAHIAAGDCRWLLLVAEFDRRQGWGTWECRSCAHWLNWKCSIDLGAARERVRVARSLAALPAVTAAFAAGELSYSKVRALTRVAEPETEDALLEMARTGTASHLERIVRAYRRALGHEEVDQANRMHEVLSLQWQHDDDGTFVLRARLTPEQGALVRRHWKTLWKPEKTFPRKRLPLFSTFVPRRPSARPTAWWRWRSRTLRPVRPPATEATATWSPSTSTPRCWWPMSRAVANSTTVPLWPPKPPAAWAVMPAWSPSWRTGTVRH
jgi:hypothetical protein